MADNLKSIPISSLPKAETLETDDQIIAYRSDNGKAYRSNVGGLGEAAQSAISDAFSTTKAYSAGDYCIYNDTLYKFTDDKDIGAWDDSVVEKTTATAEIQSNTDLIDRGRVEYADYAPGATAVHITFSKAFESVPAVIANLNRTGYSAPSTNMGSMSVVTYNVTETDADLYVCNATSSNTYTSQIDWVAIAK